MLKIKEIRSKAKSTTLIVFKLLAGVPPIFFSIFVNDLSVSLQYSGLCGVYVAFVAPALLRISVLKRNEVFLRVALYLVLCFSAFAFVVVVVQIATATAT